MTSEAAAMAVLLRKTQWLLDDVAYELAAGRGAVLDLRQVASALDEVTLLLRENSCLPGASGA